MAKNGKANSETQSSVSAKPVEAPAMATQDMAARIGEMRSQIQLSVGQIVLALMDLPRYKHQSLGDLGHLIIHPLVRNRVAIAHKSNTENGAAKVDEETIAGIAIWATVSPAVDAKIAEQIKAGVFPVRLAPEDWISGDLPWLLDVIAGDRQQATSVLANFRQLVGDKAIKIHPLVGRLIDPAVMEKLKLAQGQVAEASTKPA